MLGPNLSFPGGGQESSICVHSLGRPALDPLDRELLVMQEVKHTVELGSQKCNHCEYTLSQAGYLRRHIILEADVDSIHWIILILHIKAHIPQKLNLFFGFLSKGEVALAIGSNGL